MVTIQVFDESESKSNELTVYTDFGGLLDEEQEEGKKNESITEIVENYTGLHCEWAVSGDFDDDGNDEICALLCASSTNYSDGQLWHFASTGNRCLFYIEEAEFETLCSIAQKIPDWLAVEVIDAVDNIDTFISDIERRYF